MTIDYIKLERAIVRLCNDLPEPPQWAALCTVEGEFLRQYPTLVEGDTIAQHTHSHAKHALHMMPHLDDGEFTYSIHVGTDGVYFTFMLGAEHVLGINYRDIKSIERVGKAIQDRLRDVLPLLADEEDEKS